MPAPSPQYPPHPQDVATPRPNLATPSPQYVTGPAFQDPFPPVVPPQAPQNYNGFWKRM